ncbi:MAG: VWA domain-containing protein [Candidatus Acidiferrales bacterium]
MRLAKTFTFGTFAMLIFSAGAMFAPAAAAQSSAASRSPAKALSSKTRLITVDVVASDSHGNSIAGLKASDFQIFDDRNGPQKIARFVYFDRSAKPGQPAASAAAHETAGTYSNQAYARLAVPPTVLLIDALNIEFGNHAVAQRHALMLLDDVPADTPIAVFLLTHSLTVVQGFTTDRALLRNGVDRAFGTSVPKIENPQDDPDSPANKETGDERQKLQDAQQMAYAEQLTVLADQNADAMMAMANYLKDYPGRKNLVWISEAFPLWIEPGANYNGNTDAQLASYTRQAFAGSASFAPQVRSAAEALTDARVTIYPVDARGLDVSGLYSASTDPPAMTSGNPQDAINAGALMGAQLIREDTDRGFSQDTMEKMAADTGGIACRNTNDLSGCVATAMKDGASYYEISYYPENVRWDGSFHAIMVKTPVHGVKLRFRRGYFATDTVGLAKQKPMQLLRDACASQLPATTIPLTAEAIAPPKSGKQSDETRYFVTISASGLSLTSVAGSLALNLQTAVCEYDPKGKTFRIYERDISRAVAEGADHSWQAQDVRNVVVFKAKPDTQRLRIAVLDAATGMTGALDVPAHPQDFVALSSSVAPGGSAAKPDAVLFTHLAFRSSSGESGSLEAKGGLLAYVGKLGADRAAPAFFESVYGKGFHCEAGSLIANDPAFAPNFEFAFRNSDGLSVMVNLAGDQPAYSDGLVVDSSAKAFFDRVWKLCHCQAQ